MEQQMDVKGLKVLLVDDDDDVREFLVMALEGNGIDVEQAIDAEQAVELLKKHPFDAVTTDKNLPGMDGIALIAHIRAHYGDLPVVLITGQGTVRSAVHAFKLGAQDYLLKPLESEEELIHAIWKAVRNRRLESENRSLQEELERSKRMEALGILAGGVAHDLNNVLCPLVLLPRIILSQVKKMCANNPEGIEKVAEELGEIESLNKRAADVVQELVTLSEVGSYEKMGCDLNEVIMDFLSGADTEDLKQINAAVSLEVELAEAPGSIMGSPAHIKRSLRSVVKNSYDAINKVVKETGTSEGHKVVLRTRAARVDDRLVGYEIIEKGDYVVLEVVDTGVGIPPENMERIFEPFFTTNEMSSTTGRGLGLAIVRRVVQDHGARIDIKSTVGKGTTFSMYFPVPH